MKNYLSLAALLGVVAFVSVSYLAQAEPEMKAVDTAIEAAAPVADAAAEAVAAPVVDPVQAECEAAVAAMTKEDGTAHTAEEVTAAVEKCVADKAAAAAVPATDAMPAVEEKAAE